MSSGKAWLVWKCFGMVVKSLQTPLVSIGYVLAFVRVLQSLGCERAGWTCECVIFGLVQREVHEEHHKTKNKSPCNCVTFFLTKDFGFKRSSKKK